MMKLPKIARPRLPLPLLPLLLWLTACPGPTPTPLPPTATSTPIEAPTASPTETPTPEEPVAPAEVDPGELEALLVTELGISASDSGPGLEGVRAFPLVNTPDETPLWVAYTYGLRSFDPPQHHVLAIYTVDETQGSGWQALARADLVESGDPTNLGLAPDFVADGAVTQTLIEPTHLWIQLEGGVGAHSGVYGLFSFADGALTQQLSGFSSSPGVAQLADLNGDGIEEVLLDATDYYVFCYACGVRRVEYTIHRWDGAQMTPLLLAPLPDDAPAPLVELNVRALQLVEAGLWKDALATIDEALTLSVSDPSEVFTWNSAAIRLNAEAKRDAIADSAYPLLAHIFYGDFEAAVGLIRDEAWVDGAFIPDTPLIVGTVAEGWEEALAEWITGAAESALAYDPELAAAHFLMGWAAYVQTQDEAAALPHIQRAAELAPDDEFYAKSVEFLGG